MSTESDASVISRSLRQPECFELVFDRHFDRLLAYLRRRVGAELAAELASDTFERAFRSRGRFTSEEGSALPWLFGIAGNVLRMHWRAEERRLRAFAREAQFSHSPDGADPATQVGVLGPVLAEALAGLSGPLREVLLLHAWGELTADEIAAALEVTPAAVRTRLHRARSQMEHELGLAATHDFQTEATG